MTSACSQERFGWDFYRDCEDEFGDWQIKNGDLKGTNQLHSAIIIQLFTDRAVSEQEALQVNDGFDLLNKGGFWGDYYAEFPIGSKLWLLKRSALTVDTAEDAKLYVIEALTPLLRQGAFVRMKVDVQVQSEFGLMTIEISLFGKDGQRVYDNKFSRFWGEQ